MKSFKQLKTSLSASFESFVNEVENQESVVDCAIYDIKEVLGSTCVQIKDVERGISAAEKRKKELHLEKGNWQARAKQVHKEDLDMAKDCVKKVLHLKDEIDHCQKNIEAGKNSLLALVQEKQLIQQKLREIESKRHSLLSKESRVKISSVCSANKGGLEVEDVFKRWENKIVMKEAHCESLEDLNTIDTRDEVEVYFENKEQEERIKKEMDALLEE